MFTYQDLKNAKKNKFTFVHFLEMLLEKYNAHFEWDFFMYSSFLAVIKTRRRRIKMELANFDNIKLEDEVNCSIDSDDLLIRYGSEDVEEYYPEDKYDLLEEEFISKLGWLLMMFNAKITLRDEAMFHGYGLCAIINKNEKVYLTCTGRFDRLQAACCAYELSRVERLKHHMLRKRRHRWRHL